LIFKTRRKLLFTLILQKPTPTTEDVLNEAEQASNSLIPEKSKGRYLKSNETIKQ
jgi:hypothetical protein